MVNKIAVKLPDGQIVYWPPRVLILGYGIGPNAVWGPEASQAAQMLEVKQWDSNSNKTSQYGKLQLNMHHCIMHV